MRKKEAMGQFKKCFEQLAYSKGYSEVFNDFLDFALHSLNINRTEEDLAHLQRINSSYKESEGPILGEMLQAWSFASDNDGAGFYDALGDLFMEYVSFGRNGQFFTPDDITEMMAELTGLQDLQDGQTVYDCACGSGRTLLSAAKRNRNGIFIGADIDATCCKMTVLNMLVNTLTGEVAHMDSLSLEHWGSWHLNKCLLPNGFYVPYFTRTGAGKSKYMTTSKDKPPAAPQKPVIFRDTILEPDGVQASLF